MRLPPAAGNEVGDGAPRSARTLAATPLFEWRGMEEMAGLGGDGCIYKEWQFSRNFV